MAHTDQYRKVGKFELHELIGEGILEMRHGQGTFVRELTAASAIRLWSSSVSGISGGTGQGFPSPSRATYTR